MLVEGSIVYAIVLTNGPTILICLWHVNKNSEHAYLINDNPFIGSLIIGNRITLHTPTLNKQINKLLLVTVIGLSRQTSNLIVCYCNSLGKSHPICVVVIKTKRKWQNSLKAFVVMRKILLLQCFRSISPNDFLKFLRIRSSILLIFWRTFLLFTGKEKIQMNFRVINLIIQMARRWDRSDFIHTKLDLIPTN